MTLKRTLLGALALVVSAGGLATTAQAQTAGSCSLGSASTDLDINNVRARIFNTGALFWKGAGNVYNVPKAPVGAPITPNAVFAGGVWLAGLVGTELRAVAADYGNYELWPGPLNADGSLPSPTNCSSYDRIWLLSREQLRNYVFNGTALPDITTWPTGLGAPTFVDANRNAVREPNETVVVPTSRTQVINLQANQLPLLTGDQMAWWIMNDVGGTKRTTLTKPLGLEVQVSAFAFAREGALGNTTFYRYKLSYKGTQPLTQAYFGVWSDPDLGNAVDDYVGSNEQQGLGYVYNADNNDEGSDGYGTPPPALGYDFFQGPLVDATGETYTDPDGTVYQNKTRLPATGFMYYNNGAGNNGDPRDGTRDWYDYMRGFWQNGNAIRGCGNGDATARPECGPVKFMFPGNPVTKQGWSEFNIFPGVGSPVANAPSDRRFLISTGPFTINPGDEQTLVYGIVWARGGTNLGSVTALGRADNLAQVAFDNNFILPDAPDAPRVAKAEQNREVILTWSYNPTDNNFQNSYRAPLSVAGQETFYEFEGFNIFRYPTQEFNAEEAELVATYDKVNGVTQVIESNDLGTTSITANGSDNGLQYSYRETGLANYKQYYYGVQAYAYNPDTPVEQVLRSQVTRVTAVPQPTTAQNGGTADVTGNTGREVTGTRSATTKGEGTIFARVIDPTRVTGDSYRLSFYEYNIIRGTDTTTVLTYDIVNARTNARIFDGRAYANRTGEGAPQEAEGVSGAPAEIAQADGLSFFVGGPAPEIKDFITTRNAAGPITPTEIGAFAFNGSGFPHSSAGDRPTARQQSTVNLGGTAGWGIHTFGARTTYAQWLARTTRDGGNNAVIFPNDYEWRFTGTSLAERAFDGDAPATMTVPFEIWSLGTNPNSPADDVRMIPLVCVAGCGAGTAQGVFDIGGDSPLSGGADDPITDAVYWYFPVNKTPGQAGYNAYFNGGTPNDAAIGDEAFARVVLMGWNMGATPAAYRMQLPEQGTHFRILTTKPNQPGDVYSIATDSVLARVGQDSLFQLAIDRIGISPNPYRGASDYETSNLGDIARFTGLPERATIRIFTLSGTLIRTLSKSGPDRYLEWDLQTENALPIASGMYLIHVDVLDSNGQSVGEKVIKFGVVKKRIQLDLL